MGSFPFDMKINAARRSARLFASPASRRGWLEEALSRAATRLLKGPLNGTEDRPR